MLIYVVDAFAWFHLGSFPITVDLLFVLSFARVLAVHTLPKASLRLAEVRWLMRNHSRRPRGKPVPKLMGRLGLLRGTHQMHVTVRRLLGLKTRVLF
jgi:hypothetical protein